MPKFGKGNKDDGDKSIAEQNNQIDYARHLTHKIFNVTKDVRDFTFKRQSMFKYKNKKDSQGNVNKIYKAKTAELKIEFYDKDAQFEIKSDKKGHKDLNLSDYIN